jgi:hypothetical protein
VPPGQDYVKLQVCQVQGDAVPQQQSDGEPAGHVGWTVMGNTLSKLKNELAGNDLTCNNVKSYMQYIPVPEQEKWRLDFFEELMEADAKTITIENMNAEDITSMIDMLCTT